MSIPLLLDTLVKMEQESDRISEPAAFFCQRVIPFIAEHPLLKGLRREWINEFRALNDQALQAEMEAQNECFAAYHEIKKALQTHTRNPENPISKQIIQLDHLVNERDSFPLSRALYQNIHELFRVLLKAGDTGLCRQFCKISSNQVTIVTQQEPRWFIITDGDTIEVTSEEKKTLQEQGDRRLFSVPVTTTWDEHHIDTCCLTDSYNRAHMARELLSAKNDHNPAIVWRYFEKALWCWNTPIVSFEETFKGQKNHNYVDIKEAWREIFSIKESRSQVQPILFTKQLFKQGMKTLTSAISAYFSTYPTEEALEQSIKKEVMFKLTLGNKELSQLENGTLGMTITADESPPQYFYLKRFNTESEPFRFAKMLLSQYASGGLVEIKSDSQTSIAKFIDRI